MTTFCPLIREYYTQHKSLEAAIVIYLSFKLIVIIIHYYHSIFIAGYKGLWHRSGHKPVREQCFSLVAEHYNGIPFGYSTLKIIHTVDNSNNSVTILLFCLVFVLIVLFFIIFFFQIYKYRVTARV